MACLGMSGKGGGTLASGSGGEGTSGTGGVSLVSVPGGGGGHQEWEGDHSINNREEQDVHKRN